MVAIAGSGWRLAPCLVDLFNEADRLWPNRSRASDGSIGDSAHSTRESDHNPDGGWVDAGDLTDDKAAGCDADLLAHHLVATRDERVSYLIWNGTVVRSYAKPGLPAWTPEPYTGPNAHFQHTHISVTEAGRFIRAPWFPQEDDMPTIEEIRAAVAAENNRVIGDIQSSLKDVTGIQPGQNLLGEIQTSMKAIVGLAPAGGDVDEAEVARQIVAALPASLKEAVKAALREGTG